MKKRKFRELFWVGSEALNRCSVAPIIAILRAENEKFHPQ